MRQFVRGVHGVFVDTACSMDSVAARGERLRCSECAGCGSAAAAYGQGHGCTLPVVLLYPEPNMHAHMGVRAAGGMACCIDTAEMGPQGAVVQLGMTGPHKSQEGGWQLGLLDVWEGDWKEP